MASNQRPNFRGGASLVSPPVGSLHAFILASPLCPIASSQQGMRNGRTPINPPTGGFLYPGIFIPTHPQLVVSFLRESQNDSFNHIPKTVVPLREPLVQPSNWWFPFRGSLFFPGILLSGKPSEARGQQLVLGKKNGKGINPYEYLRLFLQQTWRHPLTEKRPPPSPPACGAHGALRAPAAQRLLPQRRPDPWWTWEGGQIFFLEVKWIWTSTTKPQYSVAQRPHKRSTFWNPD